MATVYARLQLLKSRKLLLQKFLVFVACVSDFLFYRRSREAVYLVSFFLYCRSGMQLWEGGGASRSWAWRWSRTSVNASPPRVILIRAHAPVSAISKAGLWGEQGGVSVMTACPVSRTRRHKVAWFDITEDGGGMGGRQQDVVWWLSLISIPQAPTWLVYLPLWHRFRSEQISREFHELAF